MELLNHFVAAHLMKDAQLFERIGRYDGTQKLIGRGQLSTSPVDDAEDTQSWAEPAARPVKDDTQVGALANAGTST